MATTCSPKNDFSDRLLGTATLSGGSASFSTSTLTVGAHSPIAAYSGDSTFNQSSSLPASLQVNKATTATVLTASPASSSPGQSVQLSARVTPATAGSITFMDGTVAIGAPVALAGGIASTTTSSLTDGSHTLKAVYSGDGNFLGSTSPPVTQSVGLPPATPTATTLSVAPATSTFGQAVTLTAAVTPSGATGSVTFMDATATLGSLTLGIQTINNGTATLTTTALSAGGHSLSAIYSGDSTFATSTSPSATETVSKGNSGTVLSVSPSPAFTGQQVTLSATVAPATATGTVTFLDSSTTLGSGTVVNGTATFTTSSLLKGSHGLTATYAGDVNLNGSTSDAVVLVVNGPLQQLGTIFPAALGNAIVGVPYSQTFTVSGGTLPLTWSLASGSVPGLTLSPSGVLSGTPTTAGTTPLTVHVQDSSNPSMAADTSALRLTMMDVPSPAISVTQPATPADQPVPTMSLSPGYSLALTATFTLTFAATAANLPTDYPNPNVRFISGGTTAGPITIPANSIVAVPLPAIQLGTVAGTITVTLASLTTDAGQSVFPANPVTTTITVPRLAPIIVPGSVKITNITSSGFQVTLDASSTPRDLTTGAFILTAAPGTQLNGCTPNCTVPFSNDAAAWFVSTPGVANGGAFSLMVPFTFSGDTSVIGTVSVTLTNSVSTSAPVSGGR